MLTKNLTQDWYYQDGGEQERSIKKMMDDTYNQASTLNLAYWTEADIDTRFKAGDQTLWNDYYGNLPAFRRKQFYFNRIRRITNLITGYQRRNRKTLVTYPVGSNDDLLSSQNTKLLFAMANKSNLYDKISEAFDKGSVTTGMSLLHFYLDYTFDPESGDLKCDHVPYNSFLIDPYFKEKDLSDCNYIWRRKWLSKDYVKLLLPKRASEIDKMNPRGNRDGRFQFMAENYNYGIENLFTYDEYYYRDTREAKILIETNTRLTKEWQGKDEDLELFLSFNPNVIVKKTIVPTIRMAILVDGKLMYDGPNQLGIDEFPFACFLGYYEPEIPYFPWRVQGVVRNLRDAQFLYNRRKIIELDIMESQINSGWKYKPNSLVNPNDIFLEGQGKGLAIKQEAEMTDVEKIQPAQVPPSMIQLSEILGREIMEISGVNEELLGSADDDKAGILSMLRQGAGLTTLQILFDKLDFATKMCGKIMLVTAYKNYSIGKLTQILEEEPAPEFQFGIFPEYDIRVEEGAETATQKQMQFMQLYTLWKDGMPIPAASLLECAPIQNKQELIQQLQQQEEQQQQMQMAQAQQQQQLLDAEINAFNSKAQADQGLSVERLSRVEENRALAVERIADARENRSKSTLDYAKAIKELESMDLDQIQKLISIANIVRQDMQASAEIEEQEELAAQRIPSAFLGETVGGIEALQNLG
jgi:hypothetical protein